MLQIQKITKEYITGDLHQIALNGISLNLRDNEFVAILGPSIVVQLSRQKSKLFIMN